ncbi:mohawk homeobox a isoform X1 [Tachysurus ichikawai]
MTSKAPGTTGYLVISLIVTWGRLCLLCSGVVFAEAVDHGSTKCDNSGMPKEKGRGKDDTYWREINAAMALTNLAKPKDGAPAGTTSCIIQKSSHIAEIKTVKVPIMHKY